MHSASVDKQIDYLPTTLKTLLSSMFLAKDSGVKIAAIGQAVVQAARPRAVIAPLQLALGLQVHHLSGLRSLIDTLYRLGFYSSYEKIQL